MKFLLVKKKTNFNTFCRKIKKSFFIKVFIHVYIKKKLYRVIIHWFRVKLGIFVLNSLINHFHNFGITLKIIERE